MKRYIKSAVVSSATLKDWIAKHQDSDFEECDRIVVYDDTPYKNGYRDELDVPGVLFWGTFEELKAGEGDIYITPDEYDHYFVEEERPMDVFNELWIMVSNSYG